MHEQPYVYLPPPKDGQTNEDAALSVCLAHDLFLNHKKNEIVIVTKDHNFLFYDMRTMKKKKLVIGFNDEIVDIKCFPDQERFAVAANSEQVRRRCPPL